MAAGNPPWEFVVVPPGPLKLTRSIDVTSTGVAPRRRLVALHTDTAHAALPGIDLGRLEAEVRALWGLWVGAPGLG